MALFDSKQFLRLDIFALIFVPTRIPLFYYTYFSVSECNAYLWRNFLNNLGHVSSREKDTILLPVLIAISACKCDLMSSGNGD